MSLGTGPPKHISTNTKKSEKALFKLKIASFSGEFFESSYEPVAETKWVDGIIKQKGN